MIIKPNKLLAKLYQALYHKLVVPRLIAIGDGNRDFTSTVKSLMVSDGVNIWSCLLSISIQYNTIQFGERIHKNKYK